MYSVCIIIIIIIIVFIFYQSRSVDEETALEL